MRRLEIRVPFHRRWDKKNLGWIRNAGERKKRAEETVSVRSDFQHQKNIHWFQTPDKRLNVPSRWFLDIYFSASSRRMTGMEIFRTTIHWDQRRGVTWKINWRTKETTKSETSSNASDIMPWSLFQSGPDDSKHRNCGIFKLGLYINMFWRVIYW